MGDIAGQQSAAQLSDEDRAKRVLTPASQYEDAEFIDLEVTLFTTSTTIYSGEDCKESEVIMELPTALLLANKCMSVSEDSEEWLMFKCLGKDRVLQTWYADEN